MQKQQPIPDEQIELARALLASLEAGQRERADQLIAELSEAKEHSLFQEVGRLTRELHEAINGFLLDARISELTDSEIPDAKDRLNHVIRMTEQSADRSLTAVEQGIPLVEAIEAGSAQLLREWERLRTRLLDKDDFKELSDSLQAFLQQTQGDAGRLHGHLSEVLMAQDFQDLTGQIIRKVIELVTDVEEKLLKLVLITGGRLEERSTKTDDPTELAGPAVPGVERGDQVTNQGDVDDLLSSLGF